MINKKLEKLALAIFLLITCCIGCGPSDHSVSITELMSAPEKIQIDNRVYTLKTELWRDFMPVQRQDDGIPGSPLIALIWVCAEDSLDFPSSLTADRLWIINGQEVWETEFSNEYRPYDPYNKNRLEKVARNGPKWEPYIAVDVIVRLIDRENNSYLIKAVNQGIGRSI